MGGLKYDMLTVAALDKIHATLNYMLEEPVIEWEKDLRTTYNKYLLPANLDITIQECGRNYGKEKYSTYSNSIRW